MIFTFKYTFNVIYFHIHLESVWIENVLLAKSYTYIECIYPFNFLINFLMFIFSLKKFLSEIINTKIKMFESSLLYIFVCY